MLLQSGPRQVAFRHWSPATWVRASKPLRRLQRLAGCLW